MTRPVEDEIVLPFDPVHITRIDARIEAVFSVEAELHDLHIRLASAPDADDHLLRQQVIVCEQHLREVRLADPLTTTLY